MNRQHYDFANIRSLELQELNEEARMGVADFKTAQQAHQFLNTRITYDAWAVYSSRPPFQYLGTMNRPDGTGVDEALAAARMRWREPAPVLVDLIAAKLDEDAAYNRMLYGN